MLQTLSIKNYALISNLEIQFGAGLNILTGETGAGKSIIIGALGTILGDRVDASLIRTGASKAIVEGKFSVEGNLALNDYLTQNDLMSDDGQVIVRREVLDTGRSRAFVNDSPVQLSRLQEVGDLLVDLHGQHDHQSLLKIKKHLHFLDEFGALESDLERVRKSFTELRKLIDELKLLEEKQKSAQEKRDFYSFQIEEVNKINPLPGEEEGLLREEKITQNGERLFTLTSETYQRLYEAEDSVFVQLSKVHDLLNELEKIDGKFSEHKKDSSSAKLIIDELAKFVQQYNTNIEFNPERVEEIQNRIAALSGLKKKYNRTIEGILSYRDQIQSELENLESLDDQINKTNDRVAEKKSEFSSLCLNLSQKRKAAAKRLEKFVPEILQYLGMPGSRFNVVLEYQDDPFGVVEVQGKTYRGSAGGMDIAKFCISTNAGAEIRPLTKVASGGEISRIMLALKSVLAKKGQIPVLIFDEIDNGISGRIAHAVGRKLQDLSEHHQLVCITHLPQIASMGNAHFLVEKSETDGKTATSIRQVSGNERTEAIAKLLAGERISEAHLSSARELLQDAAL